MVEPTRGEQKAALTQRLSNMEDILVTEVRLVADQSRITLFGLPDLKADPK